MAGLLRPAIAITSGRALLPAAVLLVLLVSVCVAQDRGAEAIRPIEPHRSLAPPKAFALVIGIDQYTEGWPRLANAVKDSVAVADELSRQGFEVDIKRDLDASSLKDAVEDFIYERGQDPDSRLLLWFAGHGHTVEGEAYLVPADAPSPEQDARFRRKALSMRDFGKFMREARARHVLAIFDSCFSGGVFETTRSAVSPSVGRALELPVRQMISSGQADQAVSDDGKFRRLFVDALNGLEPLADANKDGYLTGSELGLFLADKVTTLTQNRQTPHFGKLRELGFDRGDFVFKVAPNESTATPVGLPGPLPPPPTDAPDKPPAEVLPPPSPRRTEIVLRGGETKVLSDGRLVFSLSNAPGNRAKVFVNGKRMALGLGSVVTVEQDDGSCHYSLIDMSKGEVGATFLEQCGATHAQAKRANPATTVSLTAPPTTMRDFSMSGGSSEILDPGGAVFAMIRTPYGSRRDLVGVMVNGQKASMAIGQPLEIFTDNPQCSITATSIYYKENRADFLWRCY